METSYYKLWQYNDWANRSLLSSLENQAGEIPYQTIHLLSHIMNAQSIWVSRIAGRHASVGVWDDHNLQSCRNMHEQASVLMGRATEKQGADLQQVIVYKNTKGIEFQSSLDDILLHIFTHGSYHRGQIAQDLRNHTLEPINTDYISFAR
jgi:uncharacterized damage-inducible protein DinB